MVSRLKNKIKKIRKRDGSIVSFKQEKITLAIEKAVNAVYPENKRANKKRAKVFSDFVVFLLNQKYQGKGQEKIPDVEEIQDAVEEILEKNNERVAKAYMLYRRARAHAREIKKFFDIKDDLKFSVNALKVLEERYLLKDKKGKVIETPSEMFERVAKCTAKAEKGYGKSAKEIKKTEKEFYELMSKLYFLPNSPTLMNAGTPLGQLSACFVLPIEDSLQSIFTTLKNAALIQQSGGGTGFSFSNLRPRGDIVKSTKGAASGPVSFMYVYNETTETIKQGGKRRGANMGILHIEHPDIVEFINAKRKKQDLSNFNISVALTEKFMQAVLKNKLHSLINPRTKQAVKAVKAKELFNEIAKAAWLTGDPGIIFIDEINRHNPTPQLAIEATNPCGEQPLLPYESCNLGSINLSKFVKTKKGKKSKKENEKEIDWKSLEACIRIAVHFLDNVIDVNKYPLNEIEEITKENRKIGLGVMGLADLLIKLRIPYNSEKALKIAEQLMKFISQKAREASEKLAKERGSFPNFKKSVLARKFRKMRNAAITTVAPTGSISIIAGCSSGIEPLFALAFIREITEGKKLLEVNQLFQIEMLKRDFYSEELIKEIAKTGSIKKTKLPLETKNLFVTALDIPAEWHVKMQAAFQKYTDNAVSKTINLPQNAKQDEIKRIFLLAHKLKCKGITIYRYGSKKEQVLYLGTKRKYAEADLHYSGGCLTTLCSF